MALSIAGAISLLASAPTALFPIALGLAGLGAGLRTAASLLNSQGLSETALVVLAMAGAVLIVDIALYGFKTLRARKDVRDDFAVATRANLFAPGFMAAMVIGGQFAAHTAWGGPLWLAATLGHSVLLLRFVGRWLTREFSPEELNPTWFLPAAGIMTAALTWPGYGPIFVPAFTLAVGAMLWILLLPLVFRRLVFEPVLNPKLRPSLFILAAPFGLAAGGLITLSSEGSGFPEVPAAIPIALLSGGVFFILVLLLQPRFLMAAGVTLSWWATTFPIAVVATGYLRLAEAGLEWAAPIGLVLLGLATLTTCLAIAASIRALGRTCLSTIDSTEDDLAAMNGLDRMPD